MDNNILFLCFLVFLLSLSLFCLRMGKSYLFAFVAFCTVAMNIFVLKQFELFGLMVTGGNALYGAIFLSTDLLSEHYGKKEAQKAVWIGLGTSIAFVITLQVLLMFVPSSEDFAQESLSTLFAVTPRILLGSLLAFAIAQTLDVWLFDFFKKKFAQHLWIRNNASTLISQFIDTLIFTFVGLTTFVWAGKTIEGVIPMEIFWSVFVGTYIIKILVSVLDTPFIYMSKMFQK